MVVDFVASADGQEVKYTPAKGGATTTQAASCTQTTLNGYTAFFCNALMKGIKANTEVTYTVGSQATGYSAAYTFTNERAGPSPLVFAMYADFGLGNDESLAALIKAGANKEFDAVIHAGDFGASSVVAALPPPPTPTLSTRLALTAPRPTKPPPAAYDFDDANSKTGNGFMNSMQPYSATVPYMASPGNHGLCNPAAERGRAPRRPSPARATPHSDPLPPAPLQRRTARRAAAR
jgi:hypothetical protein